MFKCLQKIKNWWYLKHQSYNKKNKERVITIFAVYSKEPGEPVEDASIFLNERQPITFTSTMQEALCVVERLSYDYHYEHYIHWCELRNEKIGIAEDSWTRYKDITNNNPVTDDNYTIIQIAQTVNDVASMCRSFSNCIPMGLSYEKEFELPSFIASHYDPITNSLNVPESFSNLMKSDPALNAQIHHLTQQLLTKYKKANIIK